MNTHTLASITSAIVAICAAIIAKILLLLIVYISHRHKKQIKEIQKQMPTKKKRRKEKVKGTPKQQEVSSEELVMSEEEKKKIDEETQRLIKEYGEQLKTLELSQSLTVTQPFTRTLSTEELREREDELSNASIEVPSLELKNSLHQTVARISIADIEKGQRLDVSQKLQPVTIHGTTYKTWLLSGISEIKKELALEKANPNRNFYNRRLIFSTQYAAYLNMEKTEKPSDNASLDARRNWQEAQDLFKEYQVLYDELINLKRVDMTNDSPNPRLESTPSVDELDLNDDKLVLRRGSQKEGK